MAILPEVLHKSGSIKTREYLSPYLLKLIPLILAVSSAKFVLSKIILLFESITLNLAIR